MVGSVGCVDESHGGFVDRKHARRDGGLGPNLVEECTIAHRSEPQTDR